MPEFAYIARNSEGQRVTGVVTAANEREVVFLLSGRALFPVQVTPDQPQRRFIGVRRISGQLMAITYGQLASLIRSGVALLRSIQVIRDQTSNARLKTVLDDIHTRVEDGATLADAMRRHPRVFSEVAVSMIRAGGEGGFLEDALDRVAQLTEQQEDLKSRTMGALAYPVFLLFVGTVVVGGLVVFFVPKFATIFDRLRQRGELPDVTEWLLWTSDTMRAWGWLLLIFVGLVTWLVNARLATEKGKHVRDRLKLRVPLAGAIFKNLAVARFCRVLGVLLHNGVPILKSLEISREAAGNRILSDAIADASENISSGQSLAEPISACEHFPRTVVEMIAVAEESNSLEKVLVDIADGLERRTARRLDLMVRLLEPIMLLILAGIVLLVVIALLLPVVKMSSSL